MKHGVKVGDVVCHAGGGMAMTVDFVDVDEVHTMWFVGGKLHRGNFQASTLLVFRPIESSE